MCTTIVHNNLCTPISSELGSVGLGLCPGLVLCVFFCVFTHDCCEFGLHGKAHPWNDLLCDKWGIELYSVSHSAVSWINVVSEELENIPSRSSTLIKW